MTRVILNRICLISSLWCWWVVVFGVLGFELEGSGMACVIECWCCSCCLFRIFIDINLCNWIFIYFCTISLLFLTLQHCFCSYFNERITKYLVIFPIATDLVLLLPYIFYSFYFYLQIAQYHHNEHQFFILSSVNY